MLTRKELERTKGALEESRRMVAVLVGLPEKEA